MKGHLFIIIIFCCIFYSCQNEITKKTKPNVIIILADDQGWGDLSISGNTDISTTRIDQIAKEGASFDRFYVQPVCSPTRAEILTGRYHPRAGVYSTSAGGERIDLDEHLISQSFQSNGYRTACFGKWHSGGQHPYHPISRGFDEYYGFTSGHWGHYFSPPLDHNGIIVKGEGYLPDDLTNHAIDFMSEQEDPFFIFLAYNTPHSPMQVPEKYWAKFKDKKIKGAPEDSLSQMHARAALAMIENLDYNVGRVSDHLSKNALDDNTIITYMTDNGPNGARWNGNMKGRKGSTDEGGVRSPFFVKWKDHIKANLKIENIAAAIDIVPTLSDLCQLETTENWETDGTSLVPLLLEQEMVWRDRMLVQHWRGNVSVRSQSYRLDHNNQLFDMREDPSQRTSINSNQSLVVEELLNFKKDWIDNVLSELPETDTITFPIGYHQSIPDHLPARDGKAHGDIKRSNKYPNDSYFTNWIRTSDSITWEVEILKEGTYDFSIFYTCSLENVGAQMSLQVGLQRLTFAISETHDPLVQGMIEDRVPRIESYVKDFRKLDIGSLRLSKGSQSLVIKATEIPGSMALDINRVSAMRR